MEQLPISQNSNGDIVISLPKTGEMDSRLISAIVNEALLEHSKMLQPVFLKLEHLYANQKLAVKENKEMNDTVSRLVQKVDSLSERALASSQNNTLRTDQFYVADINGLKDERKSNEILSVLISKMESYAPAKLRAFYTDLEVHTGKPIYDYHNKRTKGTHVDKSKFPYRKIDTALMLIPANEVYQYAIRYSFNKL